MLASDCGFYAPGKHNPPSYDSLICLSCLPSSFEMINKTVLVCGLLQISSKSVGMHSIHFWQRVKNTPLGSLLDTSGAYNVVPLDSK